MAQTWQNAVAGRAEEIFSEQGVKLTIGGEPTFVPIHPAGAEWSYSAVGPQKLRYAWEFARALKAGPMHGATAFYCPGKTYPGEVNPRWAIKLVLGKDGAPILRFPGRRHADPRSLRGLRDSLLRSLGLRSGWVAFRDPKDAAALIWALPLDHDGKTWTATEWKFAKRRPELTLADGPAGLRIPLQELDPEIPKRAIVLEWKNGKTALFMPPLLLAPYRELLSAIESSFNGHELGEPLWQGYLPPDAGSVWTVLGVAADPGVIEVNLPACDSWGAYDFWTRGVCACAKKAGLRSVKRLPLEHEGGTGGGNHLLWGGPSLDENPLFTRPGWITSVLRFWQHHPSLAFLFTGCYVGASSQAPRPDESAHTLHDLEMAYSYLETLGPGDHRAAISETLRHLHTDVTGNLHRSEVSFDKFWDTAWPGGMLGLVEFRAIETMPKAEWMSSVALLWTALAARLLESPFRRTLVDHGNALHDRFFLPSILWADLESVLADLRAHHFELSPDLFRAIWEWRFPQMLDWREAGATLTIRRAHESWPLLSETPVDGGTTSRFVDSSMGRLEFFASKEFARAFRISINGRPLPLRPTGGEGALAGLRYRRSRLHPSLHPGVPVQLPLILEIERIDRQAGSPHTTYSMGVSDLVFKKRRPLRRGQQSEAPSPCKPFAKGWLTCDLRLP